LKDIVYNPYLLIIVFFSSMMSLIPLILIFNKGLEVLWLFIACIPVIVLATLQQIGFRQELKKLQNRTQGKI